MLGPTGPEQAIELAGCPEALGGRREHRLQCGTISLRRRAEILPDRLKAGLKCSNGELVLLLYAKSLVDPVADHDDG